MAEVAEANEPEPDSRTAAFSAATKSNATSTANSSPRSTSTKRSRRRRKRAQEARDFVPMGGTFSQSAEFLDPANSEKSSDADSSSRAEHNTSDDPSMHLGKNRLATGFRSQSLLSTTNPPGVSVEHDARHAQDEQAPQVDPIEILSSDESMGGSDDDGGMIVNVEYNEQKDEEAAQTDEDSSDEGEISSSGAGHTSDDVAASTSTLPKLKLQDLSADELEEQLKYALYNLDRSQIDLNRPVTCLACLNIGHLASACPEMNCQNCNAVHSAAFCPRLARCSKCRQQGHRVDACTSDLRVTTVPCDICGTLNHVETECPRRFFPRTSLQSLSIKDDPLHLWISCSKCASKSHLVGDCPDADRYSSLSRWSLKGLDPEQLINMSLESGARSREIEAENRNMRPAGLQIRGRAGFHHAGHGPASSASDDDGGFLRPPVRLGNDAKAQPQIRVGMSSNRRNQADRRDGFASGGRGNGPGWYATDSFGRRRSRSPRAPDSDQYRPNDRSPPSPRRFGGRSQMRARSPPRGYPPADTYRPDNRLPPKPANKPPSGRPQPPRNGPPQPVSLPTRKGSNPNLAGRAGQQKGEKQNASSGNGMGGRNGGKGKKGKRGGKN